MSETVAEECFVCAKQRGDIRMPGGDLYRDDLVYASHGKLDDATGRGYPGVLFVEPLRHVPGWGDLTQPEAERIGWVMARLCRALENIEGAERTYVSVLGHHVAHLHVWLIPRYPNTPDKLVGLQLLQWSDAPRADVREIEALCDRLRERLAATALVQRSHGERKA